MNPKSDNQPSRPHLTVRTILAFIILTLVSHLSASAQFSIDWHTIDGGGGTSTGGVYSVSGTSGQADAGQMSAGNFTLTGGFWSLLAIQTPDAPRLTISFTSTNTALVSWPSPATGWNPQQTSDLNPTNWIAVAEAISDDGTNKSILINPPVGNRFYRLFKP
jgi:hypothetical protein